MMFYARPSVFNLLLAFLAALCLFHGPAAQAQDKPLPAEAYDLKNVPDEYIIEALNFFDECEAQEKMRAHYDCRCLSAKYLDKRIEGGDHTGRSAILLSLEEECADATEAAGLHYQQCLNNIELIPVNGPAEEFCTCYANEYAKIYERLSPEPGSTMFVAIQSQAMLRCQDPALAKRLYE